MLSGEAKELRHWMSSSAKRNQIKTLRTLYEPSFEHTSFELQVPKLDSSMARRLKELRGSESQHTEAKEKAFKDLQYKVLDVARPLLFLWSEIASDDCLKDSPLADAAETALRLWGHSFQAITAKRKYSTTNRPQVRWFVDRIRPLQGERVGQPFRPTLHRLHGGRGGFGAEVER